jgi:excinuclease ABC subunit C
MKRGLKHKAEALPKKPGIYFFKNAEGGVIYIGKARQLRDRVKSYFQPSDDPKVANILAETADVDYLLTDSEREAAFLENNFIQQHQPKFNLRLKDDKSFPYLRLTVKEPFPRVAFNRKVEADGAKYFGPFSPAREARKTIHLLGKYFRVRNCDEAVPGKRRRPCLEYDLKQCSAPCVGFVSEKEYGESVDAAVLFLEGKTNRLAKVLKDKMKRAAGQEDFEEAARLRDIIKTLEAIKVKPTAISVGLEDQDIFGYAQEGGQRAVVVFSMRRGKVRESRDFVFKEIEGRPDAEFLKEIVTSFYRDREIPARILLSSPAADQAETERMLTEKAGRKTSVIVPARGKNRSLIEMAGRNAELLLRKRTDALPPLREIQAELDLDRIPARIEGFDISNTGGTETVASMVSFVDGVPDKGGYRKFKIKTVAGPNDVASLQEVLRRRYLRLVAEKAPLPDLIFVDGGLPQLGTAEKVLEDLGLEKIPLASLAKKEEIVYTPARREGLKLDGTSPALKLLQHVRDEAHRFAIRFHRQRRSKRSFA